MRTVTTTMLALASIALATLPATVAAQPRGAILRGEERGAVLRRGDYEGERGSLDTAGGAVVGPNRGGAARGFQAETEAGDVVGGSVSGYNRDEGVAVRRGVKGVDTDKDGSFEYGIETVTEYDRNEGVTSEINTVNEGSFVCSSGEGCEEIPYQ